MSSQQDMGDKLQGRYKHLGDLAKVFKHRHGTWRDFGKFLKSEFKDPSQAGAMAGTASRLDGMPCRHSPRGKHGAVLTAAREDPMYRTLLDHPRYRRPCLSHGTYENNKNGGLVVSDLCGRANNFLTALGRGDPYEETRRDFEYDPTVHSPSSPPSTPGASQVSDIDDLGEISVDNITLTQRRFNESLDLDTSTEFDRGWVFQDEDVHTELPEPGEGDLNAADDRTVSVSGVASSEDSLIQSSTRTSTKMRAATLGYLWGFADDPSRLRTEFRRLRSDDSLWVLHLCGCGISIKTGTGLRDLKSAGCCEWSHLKLGDQRENDAHRSLHQVLNIVPVSGYAALMQLYSGSVEGSMVL